MKKRKSGYTKHKQIQIDILPLFHQKTSSEWWLFWSICWSFGECRVLLYYHYSHVHSGLEW